MSSPAITTVAPGQLPKAAAATADMFALVHRDGGPMQSLAFSKLLARLIKSDLVKVTQAALFADLAWAADSVALVHDDPTPAKNGWYRKTGASGAGAWVQFEELSKAIRDQMAAMLAAAQAAATTAQAAVTQTAEVRRSVILQGGLGIGWREVNEYTGVAWQNPLGIKWYCDGLEYWPMLPDASTTLPGWRVPGAPRIRFPDNGMVYVGISLALMFDPILQGEPVTIWNVNANTGNDTTGTGAVGAPWKTIEKAVAMVNAGAAGAYYIRHFTTDFVPGNSEGWDGGFTVNPNRRLLIEAQPRADGSKPWWLPGMRRTGYAKANFAATHLGDGLYKCTTSAISAAAKNTPYVADLSVLDANGGPTFSEALSGSLADDAAVIAAADGRPVFYRRAGVEHFYVRLASGAEPDPGVNFAYVENQSQITFLLDQPCRLKIKGYRICHNTSVVPLGIQVRPKTVTLGPAAPLVVHDICAVFEDCELYGFSGNALTFMDVNRSVVEGCNTGTLGLDAVNGSTYYTPGNCNDPLQGAAQHCFVNYHFDFWHGANGFKDQPTVNTSANSFTPHSRINMTVLNSLGGFSNGSGVAVVGGAKALCLNVNSAQPRYVAPGADVYAAAFLVSGNSAYDVTVKSEVWMFDCTGSARPAARIAYVGPTARMVAVDFRGKLTRQVDVGGILQDGYGGTP